MSEFFWICGPDLNAIDVNKTISSFKQVLSLEFRSLCVWLAFCAFFLNFFF